MFNRKLLAIIKRELRSRLLSKSFIFMTLLVPLFLFALIGVQIIIQKASDAGNPDLLIISETEKISERIKSEFSQYEELKINNYNFTYEIMDSVSFTKKLSEIKEDLLSEKLTGVFFIPETSLENKEIKYYSTNPSNRMLFGKLNPAINKALINLYFEGKQFSEEDINFAKRNIDISGYRITSSEEVEEEGFGNMIALFLFTFLLYMALIFSGQATMLSVVEEKSNRIAEVLLSSASSTDLMAGKVIGAVITEVIQMIIWLSPVILLISTSWFMLPAEVMLQLDLGFIFYFLINYTIALFTFVGLFATVGAIFDNPQDAQSGLWPVMLLIIIPFLIAISLQSNPQSSIAKITSLLPFTSLLVMPARLTLVEVASWEIILSFLINTAVMLAIFPIAGRIYRVGILITGKKPKWSEVRKWILMKGMNSKV